MSDDGYKVSDGECLPPILAEQLMESANGPESIEVMCISFIKQGLALASTATGRSLVTSAIASLLNAIDPDERCNSWFRGDIPGVCEGVLLYDNDPERYDAMLLRTNDS